MVISFTNGLSGDLLRMGDFLNIIARAQDYVLYSSLMPGLNEETRDEYYEQALDWFDFMIERNPLFSHDAYMGKIYALYIKGDMDQVKFTYEEMKKNDQMDEFDGLSMLFS